MVLLRLLAAARCMYQGEGGMCILYTGRYRTSCGVSAENGTMYLARIAGTTETSA